MASRILIFDHFCKPLAELTNIPSTPRSWVTNGYGKCEFSIGYDPDLPQSSQQARNEWLDFGRLIHIQHVPSTDGGGRLPDWTGIILPDQIWDEDIVHVTCYGIEALLAFRAMPYVQVDGSPQDVFTKIIRYAQEKAKNISIQLGTLDNLPVTFQDDLRTNAYDHIQKLVKDSGMYFDLKGEIASNGYLQIFANLYTRKGVDTLLELSDGEGANMQLSTPLLSVTGTPSNQVFGYSHAQTSQTRVGPIEKIHQASYDNYGPLQLNQVYIGRHDNNSVTNATTQRAEQRGRPRRIPGKPSVLDINRSFDYLDIGNTLKMKSTRAGFNPNGYYGFDSTIRITTMDYNDLTNKVPLGIEILE